MLELGALVPGGQQRDIVMIALFGATTKETGIGVAVGGRKIQAPEVEILAGTKVVCTRDFEYDMPNPRGFSSGVVDGRFIDLGPGSDEIYACRAGVHVVRWLDARMLPEPESNAISERIDTVQGSVGRSFHRMVTRQLIADQIQILRGLHAPDNFSERGTGPRGREHELLGVQVPENDTWTLPGLEDDFVIGAFDGSQSPVVEELVAKVHILDAIDDCVDSHEFGAQFIAALLAHRVLPARSSRYLLGSLRAGHYSPTGPIKQMN